MGLERLEEVRASFLADLERAGVDADAVERVRVAYAGRRSGLLQELAGGLRELPSEAKRDYGRALNELKKLVEERLDEAKARVAEGRAASADRRVDITLPGRRLARGAEHPVHLVRRRIEEIFLRMGYDVEDGPEIEDDWHNFEALNMPPDHPARDDQDTFYIGASHLLRTHTSPVQARVMESRQPPIRIVVPGRVYRRDSDLRHSPMFHQLEGLVVDVGITVGHLKATLETFLRALFSDDVRVRLRPGFFPFTEPSAEVDISCIFCAQRGCGVCSGSGWIEILGSGMVDPRVFEAVGIDPERYTGFAFGLGLDRVAMLQYGIPDLRQLFAGDQRLTRQFE
ncbi:MAG: phenylalanine--tRNA ligase subunit alpha [Thermoanaerobaculales bacterium]|jgi:phenylalanyl-tRNA synthetase alpha chain|nr:phenylalanine--tRNA ligase subunit alpha [Thermoanaerobaculales bacterium]